ncbi:hypothetical protein DP116_17500 [Brasilonema bromeliae SPC951]|uniref:Uncharacterized protein n=2 Tax=Bromeliae group (in: Brasilonema) TaxID=3398495 RepID=A0ABX1P9P6_9CYAN|nr:hypothetical protein [Brasilonema bromeliae SPC951]
MANLVGLEEQIPPSRPESSLSETSSANPDEAPPSHPSSQKTKQALSSNPFAKVGVVGAATLSVALVAGAFLTQLMSGTNKQAPKNFPQITRNENESNKIEQLKPEEEIEILKTKLALAEQAKAVKLAQLQLKSVRPTTQPKPTPAQPRIKPQTVTRVVVQRVPTPAQTVYVPRVVERIVRVPQRVVVQQPKPISPVPPQPTVRPVPPQPTVPPQQTPQPTAKPSISPSFELSIPGLNPSELAQIPFALSIPTPTPTPTPTATPTPTPTPSLPRVANSPPSTLGSELNSRNRDNAQILPVPNRRNTAANPQQTPAEATTNETTQYTGKSVAVGTNAKAVLATAVFGEANRIGSNNSNSNSNNNNNNNKNDSQFVVRLREPLKSVDGAIALPANTELLAQLDQVSETGALNLTVVSVVSQNKSNLTETRLRQSAMKVRAPGGRPLLAKKYPDKSGKISAMDTFIFGLGGAGQIGRTINLPETKTRNTCDGLNDAQRSVQQYCGYFSETKQPRNIAGAVLEGGMNALVPQLNQRNQQAINEMITKSNIWYLPAGTEVEVVANQITRF